MDARSRKNQMLILVGGDILAFALFTLVGFATHGELGSAGTRMLTTFLPVTAAWFLVAPFMGAYDIERMRQSSQLWRPFWSMFLAGSLAAWMRSAWLNAAILPLFVLVLSGVNALGILAWRALYTLVISRKMALNG
jgi:hypothetical protein